MTVLLVGSGLIAGFVLIVALVERNLSVVMMVAGPTLFLMLSIVYVQDMILMGRELQRRLSILAHLLVVNFDVIAGQTATAPGSSRQECTVVQQLAEMEDELRYQIQRIPRPARWFLALVRILPRTDSLNSLTEDLGIVVSPRKLSVHGDVDRAQYLRRMLTILGKKEIVAVIEDQRDMRPRPTQLKGQQEDGENEVLDSWGSAL